MFFRLVGTSTVPDAKAAAPFLDKEHKVVEMVDYNLEENALGNRHISVLDEGYLEVMQAAQAINSFDLHDVEKEQSKREFEEACTAPLAKADEDEIIDGDSRTQNTLGNQFIIIYFI